MSIAVELSRNMAGLGAIIFFLIVTATGAARQLTGASRVTWWIVSILTVVAAFVRVVAFVTEHWK